MPLSDGGRLPRRARSRRLLVRALRLVRLPYFSLPNLLAGEALVPEFLQEAVDPCEPVRGAATDCSTMRRDAPICMQRFEAIHATLRARWRALPQQLCFEAVLSADGRGQGER